MRKWAYGIGVAFILGGACKMEEDRPNYGCPETQTNCRVVSGWGGYQRACSTLCIDQSVASNRGDDADEGDGRDDEDDVRGGPEADGAEAIDAPGGAPSGEAAANLGPAALPDPTRYSAFDIPCERDSQCGPGQCEQGNCYYGCQSDAQCGSGDRCSVESGVRICQPDPNPPVECTRSAQCDSGFTCLNGSCRQTCSSTQQCTNVLDRCGSGVCVPDRRPLGECVLNSECDSGLVCLDGACVPACPADDADDPDDAGACLAESPSAAPGNEPSSDTPSTGTPGEDDSDETPPTNEGSTAETPTDDGSEDDTPTDDDGTSDEPDEGTPPEETPSDAGVPVLNLR